MKAEELMIGDWVMLYGRPRKVGIIYDHERVEVDCTEEDCSEIEPIPLTPEILEKNGFRQSKRFSKDWQLTVYNDEVYINLGDRYTSCEHNRMVHNPEDVSEVDYSNSLEMPRPMFVHELQRFMQLANVDKDIEL